MASTSIEQSKMVLCCAVLCCAVLCCAVLCCAVLGCAALTASQASSAKSLTSFPCTDDNAAKSRVETKKLYLLVLPQQHQTEQSWQLLCTERPGLLLSSHDRLLPNQAKPHHLPEARIRHAAAVLLHVPAFTHFFCLHIHSATTRLGTLNTH